MSEQKNGNIESIINEALIGDAKKNALDFADFLQGNEMTYKDGQVSYKNQSVCYMHIDGSEQMPGPWTIWTEGNYIGENKDVPMDEHMKGIALANVNICASCGGSCSPGTRKVIFGKEFDNMCNAVMAFNNPNADTLECVKKLLKIRKHVIDAL